MRNIIPGEEKDIPGKYVSQEGERDRKKGRESSKLSLPMSLTHLLKESGDRLRTYELAVRIMPSNSLAKPPSHFISVVFCWLSHREKKLVSACAP